MNNPINTIPMDNDKTGIFLVGSLLQKPGEGENAHYLLVVQGSERGRTLELGEHPVTVGRHPDSDLCLVDPCVSKQHCTIRLLQNRVWVTDLNSTNGTFLGEDKVPNTALWPEGVLLRVGSHALKHEYRHKATVEESEHLAADIKKACAYVQSLLPAPLAEGPVRVDWHFVPSAMLGGDSFGYHWLDPDRLVFYLIDVCGHGVGPAMHAVSTLNILRRRSLTGVDFGRPAEVLGALNTALSMEEHGDMFFSIWYGIYRLSDRSLSFASGGHPPAVLLAPDGRAARDLHTPGLFLGVIAGEGYQQASLTLEPGCALCVFSDGAFEIALTNGDEWSHAGFRDLLAEQAKAGNLTAAGMYRKVSELACDGKIDDDFSLMILRFP
jgi:serine phosphatase RsbU (regulator of sigma subunit)